MRLATARGVATLVAREDVVAFKRCKFQACVVAIESEADVDAALVLVLSSKRVAKATHPAMYAWRCPRGRSGFSDGGESGAGRILLAQAERMAPRTNGLLVAVTRWYGGRSLGSARFRVTGNVARDGVLAATKPRDAGAC